MGGVNNIISFGTFPQSKKADDVTVDESENTIVSMFTYYKGDDGEWYAKKESDYYKVEPITWRVLTDNYNGNRLLLAENALMPIQYYDNLNQRTINGSDIYANNYEHSKVRAWLNGIAYRKNNSSNSEYKDKGFLQTAFTEEEQEKIATTEVDNSEESTRLSENRGDDSKNLYACENTNDKIFLLSQKEVTTNNYGFPVYDAITPTRLRVATDFAVAHGAVRNSTTVCSQWWLRSPRAVDVADTKGELVRVVYSDGRAAYNSANNSTYMCVVPALCIVP